MKYKLLGLLLAAVTCVAVADNFKLFSPATGILKGDSSTYITTPAASSDVISLWTGTCDSSTYLRADGSCMAVAGAGTVTSVGLTAPAGFSVTGSPVTGSGSLGFTTALSGVIKGTGSGFGTAANTDVITLWGGTCSSTTYLRGDGSCQTPPGTGGGTVNSVALTMPTGLTVSGSPITSAGTFAVSTTLNGPLRGNGSGFITGSTALGSEVSGILTVANGGIGVGTLTGLAKGNGTSAFSAAANADIIGLWTGTCSSGTFLRGDGACAAASGASGVTSIAAGTGITASPSPIVSTGTISINQGFTPTWTSQHTWSTAGGGSASAIELTSSQPDLGFNITTGGTNSKQWDFGIITNTVFAGRTINDANSVGSNWVAITRSPTSTAITDVTLGNPTDNPTFHLAGTGVITGVGSGLTALNGSNVSTGTIADGRLSSNVALYNGSVANFTVGTLLDARLSSNVALYAGNMASFSSGTLADIRLSGNVDLLNNAQTFSAQKFSSVVGSGSSSGIQTASTDPFTGWRFTSAGTDSKQWDCGATSGTTFACRALTDSNSSGNDWVTVTRSGANITSVDMGSGTSALTNHSVGVCLADGTNCPSGITNKFAYGHFNVSGSTCALIGPPTYASANITGCTRSGAGTYDVSVTGFTIKPTCYITGGTPGSTPVTTTYAQPGSLTDIQVFSYALTSVTPFITYTASDTGEFQVMCVGS